MEPVKPNIDFDENVNPILGINLFNQQYEKSLDVNREKQDACIKYKEELCSVRSHLETLPNELSYDVMIPIGSQGLMRGKMVHTNEILALIGDSWYVKTSGKHAVEMCQRRIERCDEMLSKHVKEFEFLKSWRDVSRNIFQSPDENVLEIIEDFDEDKEKDWRAVHRENVRKHNLEMAKLRNKENNITSDAEEALQRRLELLERQEEIEELKWYGLDESSSDSGDISESGGAENNTREVEADSLNSSGASYGKKRVSFSQEGHCQALNLEEKPEPLRIYFRHIKILTSGTSKKDNDETGIAKSPPCELASPSDVYTHFVSNITPKSILKQTSMSSSVEENVDSFSTSIPLELSQSLARLSVVRMEASESKTEDEENDQLIPQVVAFGDVVVEHNPVVEIQVHEENVQSTRPVSRFKASRQKQKIEEN